jgi:TolA-binding protein
MVVRSAIMNEVSGSPDSPPESPTVADSYEAADGHTVEIWQLSPERTAFIEATDAVLAYEFSPHDDSIEGLPDVPGALADNRAKLMYLPGQLYFHHQNYPEARKRLLSVIDEFPRSESASFAAALLVTSFINEGDLEQIRAYTKRFLLSPPGPLTDGPDDEFLQTTLEGTTFKIARQQASAGEFETAAESFLSFMDEFPDSEYASDALHNAAFYYQEVGKMERANQLYEQFVLTYPTDEKSRPIYYRIALNYESSFDLAKAIEYYDALRKRFPDDKNAEDALFNASYLRVGLGQNEAAAKGFERYAKENPDLADAVDVHWRAGEQYRAVSDDKALRFYKGFLKQYGTEQPDYAIESQYQIGQILLGKNQQRAYEQQLDEIVKTFEEIKAAGGSVGAQGHRYAAAAEFRYLVADYDDFIDDELPGDDDKDIELLDEIKPPEFKAFETKTNVFAAKYSNFEHVTGALYLQAMAVLDFADLGLSVRPPKGLSEELEWAYLDLLEENVYPQYYELENVGLRRLDDLVKGAKDKKKYSDWIALAQEELNSRRPTDYPAVKDELRGIPDPPSVRDIQALEMEEPEPEPEGEPAEEVTTPDVDEGGE